MYGAAGFFNAVQQNFCTALGQLLHILPDGRQARDAVLPQGNAVVPGYRDILRHPQPVILQSADGPQRHQVRHGEHCRNIGAVVQQILHRLVPAAQREPCVGVLLFHLKGQAQPQHGALAACQTRKARAGQVRLAADDADAPMALFVQVLDHPVGRRHIIDRHAGKVGDAQRGRAVGQQQAGDAQIFQLRGEILQVRPQKQDAVGLALRTDAPGLGDLVGFLVDVIDGRHVAALFNHALQLL